MIPLRRALIELPDYDERDLSDDDIAIRLHRNESALEPPDFVLDALWALGAETLRTYPTGLQRYLTERLALRFDREPGAVALAGGADEILAACARAVIEPGDNAIAVAPSFGMYPRVVALAGGVLRRVPYASRWQFDAQALLDAADECTRLVFLSHPNNPTGDALRIADLDTIARGLPDALIIVDEVYLAFSERSLARTAAARYENVVIAGSFSKCAALAGIRLGYLLAAPAFAAAIRRSLGPYPASAPALVAASAYLREPSRTQEFETQLEAQTARSLNAFEFALQPFARQFWRGSANFMLADCEARAVPLRDALMDCGIAIRTFDDPMLAGMIRISATDDERTALVVDALRLIAVRERAYA